MVEREPTDHEPETRWWERRTNVDACGPPRADPVRPAGNTSSPRCRRAHRALRRSSAPRDRGSARQRTGPGPRRRRRPEVQPSTAPAVPLSQPGQEGDALFCMPGSGWDTRPPRVAGWIAPVSTFGRERCASFSASSPHGFGELVDRQPAWRRGNRQALTKVGGLHDLDASPVGNSIDCLIGPQKMRRLHSREANLRLLGWHLCPTARHIKARCEPCNVHEGFR